MHRGYFKIWRKIEDNPVYQNPKTFLIFTELLMRATIKDRCVIINETEIFLKRGQAIFGTNELGQKRGLSRMQTRTALEKLITWQILTTKTTNKGSIATFCNFDTYNEDKKQNSQQNNQQVTNGQPTDNQQVTTNNNYNNSKNVKNGGEEQFTPPAKQQIFDYGKTINCDNALCNKFLEYYSSNEWKDFDKSNSPTWQQKLITWRNTEKMKNIGQKAKGSPEIITQEDYDNDF